MTEGCVQRTSKDAGDFLKGKLAEVAQHEGSLLRFRQFIQRTRKRAHGFLALEPIEWLRLGRVGERLVVGNRDVARRHSPLVLDKAVGNPKEVCLGASGFDVTSTSAPGTQKDFLQGVLDGGFVIQESPKISAQGIRILVDPLCEALVGVDRVAVKVHAVRPVPNGKNAAAVRLLHDRDRFLEISAIPPAWQRIAGYR